MASCAEDSELDAAFEIARFQVDIFGKVPHLRLLPQSEVLRDGRQTKLHCITLLADGKPLAQAHVLRVRRMETPIFEVPHDYPAPLKVPEVEGPHSAQMAGAVKLRRVLGGPGEPGRGI